MNQLTVVALAGLLALATTGCGPSRDDVQELKDTQAQILEKLSKLEEAQKAQAAARRPGRPAEDYNKVHNIEVGEAPMLGNPNAPITVVEYSDFECPYCARTAPDVKALLDKYPDKVRIVYKHFPLSFHRNARPTAVAAVAAQDQGRFWEFHDVVFAKTSQRQLNAQDVEKYAAEAGLDVERFKQDLAGKGEAYDKRVSADFADGQRVDVRGTPTLYINGKKVQNRSVEGMSQMVEALLAETAQGQAGG